MAIPAFTANSLQYGPAERPIYCERCEMYDYNGHYCRLCGDFRCRSCVAAHPMGELMEAFGVCEGCVKPAVLRMLDTLDEFQCHMADEIGAELLANRRAA